MISSIQSGLESLRRALTGEQSAATGGPTQQQRTSGLWRRSAVHPQSAGQLTRTLGLAQPNATGVKVQSLLLKLEPMQIALNTHTIIQGIRQARTEHAGDKHLMVHTSEMSITGYCCGDLHQITDAATRNAEIQKALEQICLETHGISATVGFPYYSVDGQRFILHALISDGKIVAVKGKEELANNIGRETGVEYEVRFFKPCADGTKFNLFGKEYTYEVGKRTEGNIFSDQPVVIAGKRVAIVICEEMFTGTDRIGPLYGRLEHEIDQYLEGAIEKCHS